MSSCRCHRVRQYCLCLLECVGTVRCKHAVDAWTVTTRPSNEKLLSITNLVLGLINSIVWQSKTCWLRTIAPSIEIGATFCSHKFLINFLLFFPDFVVCRSCGARRRTLLYGNVLCNAMNVTRMQNCCKQWPCDPFSFGFLCAFVGQQAHACSVQGDICCCGHTCSPRLNHANA